jgi:CheY-like chemotaxis protein
MSKILIIDDEVQIRSLLARMLELEGYEVCQAGDCKAAIKQLEIQSPDVALCNSACHPIQSGRNTVIHPYQSYLRKSELSARTTFTNKPYRKPLCSSSFNPFIVVPPGVVTFSISSNG